MSFWFKKLFAIQKESCFTIIGESPLNMNAFIKQNSD